MNSSSVPVRAARLLPWVVGFAPALVLLVVMLPLRGTEPFLDSWRFVGQYHDWVEGGYTWSDFLAHHYEHPCSVGKIIYFAVLHWLHGEVGVLPLLGWGFSLFISVCVSLGCRPLWAGHPVHGAVLMVCVNLIIFTTAQADAWVWDFLFQNFIPGACLMAGIVILSGKRLTAGRVASAGALSAVAAFSFSSGILVGALLTLLIWDGTRTRSVAARCLSTTGWLAFAGLVAWTALYAGDTEVAPVSALVAADRPGMRLHFLLALLGRLLGEGTVIEPHMLAAWMGGVLTAVFLGCVAVVIAQRHHREMVAAALPWITCALYGLGTAVLIAEGRMQRTLGPALADRYVSLTLFFTLGTVCLTATVLRHGDTTNVIVRGIRRILAPLLAVFSVAHVLNWTQGCQTMKLWHTRMEQERAMLSFIHVLPPNEEWMGERQTRPSTFRLAKSLSAQGRLRHVRMVKGDRLTAFQQGEKVPAPWARFDTPILLAHGGWELHGRGGLSDSSVADLILIAAESGTGGERIVAVTAPLLTDTFWERRRQRRQYPQHFFGWSQTLAAGMLPEGAHTLRAYAFDHDQQQARPMPGVHEIPPVRHGR